MDIQLYKLGFIMVMIVPLILAGDPPTWDNLPATIQIAETLTAKTDIFNVDATNPDGPQTLTYTMTVSPSPGPFKLTASSGRIQNYEDPGFDAALRPEYTITVCVTDNEGDTRCDGIITVEITSTQSAPVFSNLDFEIDVLESTALGAEVYNIDATDADGDDKTFYFVESVPAGTPFYIEANFGKVFVGLPLDYETQAHSWVIQINVTDFRFYTPGYLTVNLIDVAEPPSFTNMPASTVAYEVETAGRLAYILKAYDDDTAALTASMTVTPAGPFSLAWSGQTGQVNLDFANGESLDYESVTSYQLRITITDGTNSDTEDLTVNVVDVNEGPTITNLPDYVTVSEGATTASTIFTVAVTDPENDALNYDISVTPYDGGAFEIKTDGRIRYTANPGFDYETAPAYAITVYVNDGTLVAQSQILYVNITDVNEPPVISNLPATVTVSEDIRSQKSLFWVNDNDPDIGDTQTYTFSTVPASASSLFFFNSDGTLYCVDNPGFDFETRTTYSITLTVTDSNGEFDTGTITVNIQNKNERPSYPSTTAAFTLAEEEPLDTDIGLTLAATDPDLGDNITYILYEGNAAGFIVLDYDTSPPRLKISGRMDFDSLNTPTLMNAVIVAQDSGLLQDVLSVTLTITDIDDNSPVFLSPYYIGSVYENRLGGFEVITVSAQDADQGAFGAFSYSINGTLGSEYFQIDAYGVITTIQQIDAETYPMINFTVLATSVGGEVGSATVYITVLDENDHRPYFPGNTMSFDLRSDAQDGRQIGFLQAYDDDLSETTDIFTYQKYSQSDFFSMSDDGLLTVKSPVGEYVHYTLNAIAYDNGVPPDLSEILYIRIDTYVPCECLLGINVFVPPTTFNDATTRAEFLARLSSITELSTASIRLLYIQGYDADTYSTTDSISYATLLSVLVVKNPEAEEFDNIDTMTKEYYTVAELTSILANADESPKDSVISVMGSSFPIEKLNATESCPAVYVEPVVNFWLDTDIGRFCVACIVFGSLWVLIGLIALSVVVCRRMVDSIGSWRLRRKRRSTPLTEDNRNLDEQEIDQFDFRYNPRDSAALFKTGNLTPVS